MMITKMMMMIIIITLILIIIIIIITITIVPIVMSPLVVDTNIGLVPNATLDYKSRWCMGEILFRISS